MSTAVSQGINTLERTINPRIPAETSAAVPPSSTQERGGPLRRDWRGPSAHLVCLSTQLLRRHAGYLDLHQRLAHLLRWTDLPLGPPSFLFFHGCLNRSLHSSPEPAKIDPDERATLAAQTNRCLGHVVVLPCLALPRLYRRYYYTAVEDF